MSAKETGGSAFPVEETDRSAESPGMTLRDYFAAKAMQGYLAAFGYDGDSDSNIAHNAYQMADAMLKAREA
jgi:hypothetical protein